MRTTRGIVIGAVVVSVIIGMALFTTTRNLPTRRSLSGRSVPTAVRYEKVAESGPRGEYSVTRQGDRLVVSGEADPPAARTDEDVAGEAEREREREASRAESGAESGEPEGESEILSGPSAQQVDQRAYPRTYVESRRALAGEHAYRDLPRKVAKAAVSTTRAERLSGAGRRSVTSSWQTLGPTNPVVPASVTYTGRGTTNSGRVTALAIDPNCAPGGDCRLWVAAAGGGIWRTDDALARRPDWLAVDSGLPTNSFGSLLIDPTDRTGDTVYAGSGEPNGSSDSEAGLGLFKTTDGGDTWARVPGSYQVAHDRSIASIAVDPRDPDTIWIGTALARHGSSSVNGGRRTPPNAPALGVYRSTDGGNYFSLQLSRPGSAEDPASGQDYFTGGVTKLVWDPNDPDQLYASVIGYGIFRVHNSRDGVCACDDGEWHQVYQALFGEGTFLTDGGRPLTPDPYGARIEFDLADLGAATRLYVGDSSDAYGQAYLLVGDRVQGIGNQELLAAESDPAGFRAPWVLRSDPDIESSLDGFSSYNFCQNGQCGYDIFVVADPTDPDTVWLGGAMAYDELVAFGSDTPRSNGRAVVRSTDAGVSFTDMTNDARTPPLGMHPDQHALVMNPNDPGQVFVGSDGGVVRTDGAFTDGNPGDSICGSRTFTGPTAAADLDFCRQVLSVVPRRIDSLDDGLNTLQLQSVSLNRSQPYSDVIGGTQDNGTWAWDGAANWFESVGGDGGNSGISDAGATRMHTYYGPTMDVNFQGNNPESWAYVSAPMNIAEAGGESFSFYVPVLADPTVSGTYFTAGEYVWRTQDSGGDREHLETNCLELGVIPAPDQCGDFERVGPALSPDGPGSPDYVAALGRAPSDTGTMWAGLRQGEIFISTNVDAPATDVRFEELTRPELPGRFVSGMDVDPHDPNHAWISYSGYGAYTPGQPGHVFEARFDPATGAATFRDRSYDLGDQPVTGISLDGDTGDVYAATDFGVARLPQGGTAWGQAANGIPAVAVYGLTGAGSDRVLYAASHGRGVYRLPLDPFAQILGPSQVQPGEQIDLTDGDSAGYRTTQRRWTLPDGTTSAADAVSFTPTGPGDQVITLTITDALGHRATARKTVSVAAEPGLTPEFGSVARRPGGFRVPISNYDPAFTWTAHSTAGKVRVSDSGRVSVSGIRPRATARVTVDTSRSGFARGSATVEGRATSTCVLRISARDRSRGAASPGKTRLVKEAATGPGCRLKIADVKASPRPATKIKKNLTKGRVLVKLPSGERWVRVVYRAVPKSTGRTARWHRTWRAG